MRTLMRLSARLYNSALLISPEKAEAIDSVFRNAIEHRYEPSDPDPMPMELTAGATTFARTPGRYMRSDSGIALIQVLGPLVQRGAGLDAISGGFESYENVSRQLAAARADPLVKTILLELDSPGGEANGVHELAQQIRAIAAEKRVVAHANEMAFSAAYWLASSAEELYVPKTGMVGSVGVIMLHVDQSGLNERRGLDVTHIFAGARKADFSPHQPLSEEALTRAQAMVDRLYGQFVDAVAGYRGIPAQAVRATEAGLFDAGEAQRLKLVDGVASLGETVAMLANGTGRRSSNSQQFARTAATKTPTVAASAQPSKEREQDPMYVDAELRTRIDLCLRRNEVTGRERMALKLISTRGVQVDGFVALLKVAAPQQLVTEESSRLGRRIQGIAWSEASRGREAKTLDLLANTDLGVAEMLAELSQSKKEDAAGTAVDREAIFAARRGGPRAEGDPGASAAVGRRIAGNTDAEGAAAIYARRAATRN